MRFPGRRKSKHYFPVSESGRMAFDFNFSDQCRNYIVGIDQLLVDIEVNVSEEFLQQYDIPKGESVVFPDDQVEKLYRQLKQDDAIVGEYAGGAIGNTLHNYSLLADAQSVALGTICRNISVGDYAFKYLCNTSFRVELSYLRPCDGHMGRAFCFITPDRERSFVIGKGIMNDLTPDAIPEHIVKGASALLVSSYLLREEDSSMFQATMKAVEYAREYNVPVVMALGTAGIVEEKREFLLDFIKNNVTVLAGNMTEIEALSGISDPLLAGQWALDYIDLALLTVGPRGLYLCGLIDRHLARETKDQIHSKSLPEYNIYEYSRGMRRSDCQEPVKVYTHINPYMGGPLTIKNTNGAGDAALAALLHDMAANDYHKSVIPNSPKHNEEYLTYSSLHQISKYANRVSYEVLSQNSPRLSRGLPDKEECLEESYWEK